MRARASAEAASTLQQADEELSRQGQETAAELRSSIETLSTTLASRVLGVELGSERAAATTSQRR
jgi:F-type H+-transporting ATPase subunit b